MNQPRSTFALVLVACAAFTGCGSPPSPLATESYPSALVKGQPSPPHLAAESCPTAQVKGQPSQITLVSSAEGVSFEPPKTCQGWYPDAPEYYIRVHGHGKRRIDYGKRKPNECDKPDADAVACPKVHFGAFGRSVLSAMRAKLGDHNADTLGLGACARSSAPLDQWNLSCRVHDFRHADEALRIIDAELRRWDIGDDWGLTIAGIHCAPEQ